ncbi:MAG: hypothetical protein NTY64_01715 [Deltaproteobacteria bacterium]|nr:hypothetical protein [Deltaproteobacteria bacterium]
MKKLDRFPLLVVLIYILLFTPFIGYCASYTDVCTPENTWTPETAKNLGGNLEVTETVCLERGISGTYNYRFVNIYSKNGGKTEGKLIFKDAAIDFWAKSILVENGGSLIVGSPEDPIGKRNINNVVTIHLYGEDLGTGIQCKTTTGPDGAPDYICGVSATIWDKGRLNESDAKFFKYLNLPTYEDQQDGRFYFGRKVMALSYGGTIRMFGKKGANYDKNLSPSSSGTSWVRLAQTVSPKEIAVKVERPVDWQKGDRIVLTTTDYLPGHSEMLTIDDIDDSKTLLEIDKKVDGKNVDIEYPHNGQKYSLAAVPKRLRDDGFKLSEAETRAAVALLTRNIRIVSEGDNYNDGFYDQKLSDNKRYFGGHTIVRQGFKQYQVQGVEFYQLGQGGRLAHAPVNFLMAMAVPDGTYLRDCSIHDSMSHWVELRGTQKVLLERNVGFKSIGHGFVLADGTETENQLLNNIGIYARPGVAYQDNPRNVPGITAKVQDTGANLLKFAGDVIHPSVFFIMNGYNTLEGNMAAGAGTCGSCYWFAPARMSGLSINKLYSYDWEGYPSILSNLSGKAPIYSFKGNFCTTAQHSIVTVGAMGSCKGVYSDQAKDDISLKAVENPYTSKYENPSLFPEVNTVDYLSPTLCASVNWYDKPGSCTSVNSEQKLPCEKGQTKFCAVSVLDSYTSSFHWAQQNFAAIWLRSNWFLLTDSVLSDVQNGGLTMVSGGTYDQVLNSYWALTRRSAFIGSTQDKSPFISDAGPIGPGSDLKCEGGKKAQAYCLLSKEGISFPMDNFSVYQRLYNIYDGPVYQETNAFMNIKARTLKCEGGGTCESSPYMYGPEGRGVGIPKARENSAGIRQKDCILPNAAIGWKQPNAFYYPPAFHSRNLFFNDVDIRHFIIVPLFAPGQGLVDPAKVKAEYCTYPNDASTLFDSSFSDIDRQTELNDDDGTLSGLAEADPVQIPRKGGTISVNRDKFFDMPVNTVECLSQQSCLQAPYDYISAVVFADCARRGLAKCNEWNWNKECENRQCYGVPIYRQFLTDTETQGSEQAIRMMGGGISQRSTLLANKGAYYIDTTVSRDSQEKEVKSIDSKNVLRATVFDENQSYDFFLLYAKPTTRVTFQVYVGPDFNVEKNLRFIRVGRNHHDEDKRLDDATVLSAPIKISSTDKNSTPLPWPWPAPDYDSKTGILKVIMDLGGFSEDFQNGIKESCGPPSFCEWKPLLGNPDGGACVYKQDQKEIKYSGDDAICRWSVKAQECPSGGCPGFQVDFPKGVQAVNQNPRPKAEKFSDCGKIDPNCNADTWKVGWVYADGDIAKDGKQGNACVYDKNNPPPLPDRSIW